MTNVTSNFSDDMRKYVVTVPPLPTTVEGVKITLPAVVFEFDTGSSTPADVASALQEYVDKHNPASAICSNFLCSWLRINTDLDKGITSAFERALGNDNGHYSLGGFVATATLNSDPGHKLVNELRLEWARHCITALLSTPSPRNKEMNDKHDYSLLRPVKFDELSLDDKLMIKDSSLTAVCSVVYKGRNFVVVRCKDGSDTVCTRHALSRDFTLAPLCWVEGKPVYPGDGPLYYKGNPSWKHNEEGVFALSIRDDELLFHGGIAFPIDTATWTKPESVPSFQVEGQDVYPGDVVYYYGSQRVCWGVAMTVKNDGCVVDELSLTSLVSDYEKGAETFRLKPQLVIGDRLVPMPEREAPANGTTFFTPDPHSVDYCGSYIWRNLQSNECFLERGLVHLTKEAAAAHGQALVALSKKKD